MPAETYHKKAVRTVKKINGTSSVCYNICILPSAPTMTTPCSWHLHEKYTGMGHRNKTQHFPTASVKCSHIQKVKANNMTGTAAVL